MRGGARWLALTTAVLLLGGDGGAVSASPAAPTIRFQAATDREPGAVWFEGIDSSELDRWHGIDRTERAWRDAFPVRLASGDEPPLPAIFGRYDLIDGAVRFRPRFPFVPDREHVAEIVDAAVSNVSFSFTPPARSAEQPRVLAVHPGGSVVPANLLRVYVEFSVPMNPNRSHERIWLVDADGQAVPTAFVEVEHGLWDPSGRRLTVFFHPGRIKRGVGPNLAMGPPLVAGERYRLEVVGDLDSAVGVPLGEAWVWEFTAGEPDRQGPRPDTWVVREPATSEAPLTIELEAPADVALLGRLVTVECGGPVAVRPTVEAAGRRLRLSPLDGWPSGACSIHVDSALEDPSGNRIDQPFEVDGHATTPSGPPVVLPFRGPARDGASSE